MPWYLYIALNQLFPTGKRFSFFSFMSIFGVTIGVFVLFVSLAIMSGFQHEIFEKLMDTNGDIRIESGRLIEDWEAKLEQIESDPAVVGANPYVAGVVMLVYRDQPHIPHVWSVDPGNKHQVFPFEEKDMMLSGEFDDLDDESVLIGSGIARNLGLSVGDVVSIYTPLMVYKADKGEMILPRELEVAGIFESGWEKVDNDFIIFSLRLMQELYGLDEGNEIHGINIRLTEDANIDDVALRLERMLGGYFRATTWLETEDGFLKMLAFEKAMIFLLTAFIILVASFSISSTMLTSVITKTREIGLLGALGARPHQIALVYCSQSFIIGIGGLVSGLLLGFLFLGNVDAIIYLVFKLMGTQNAFLEFYMFHKVPVHYTSLDLIGIIFSTIVMSILAALVPAWRAGRLKPADALRYE